MILMLHWCNVNILMILETKSRVSIEEAERKKDGIWKVKTNLWWQISIGGISMKTYKLIIGTFYGDFKGLWHLLLWLFVLKLRHISPSTSHSISFLFIKMCGISHPPAAKSTPRTQTLISIAFSTNRNQVPWRKGWFFQGQEMYRMSLRQCVREIKEMLRSKWGQANRTNRLASRAPTREVMDNSASK